MGEPAKYMRRRLLKEPGCMVLPRFSLLEEWYDLADKEHRETIARIADAEKTLHAAMAAGPVDKHMSQMAGTLLQMLKDKLAADSQMARLILGDPDGHETAMRRFVEDAGR